MTDLDPDGAGVHIVVHHAVMAVLSIAMMLAILRPLSRWGARLSDWRGTLRALAAFAPIVTMLAFGFSPDWAQVGWAFVLGLWGAAPRERTGSLTRPAPIGTSVRALARPAPAPEPGPTPPRRAGRRRPRRGADRRRTPTHLPRVAEP